jgi:hypothetical protein
MRNCSGKLFLGSNAISTSGFSPRTMPPLRDGGNGTRSILLVSLLKPPLSARLDDVQQLLVTEADQEPPGVRASASSPANHMLSYSGPKSASW